MLAQVLTIPGGLLLPASSFEFTLTIGDFLGVRAASAVVNIETAPTNSGSLPTVLAVTIAPQPDLPGDAEALHLAASTVLRLRGNFAVATRPSDPRPPQDYFRLLQTVNYAWTEQRGLYKFASPRESHV
jgi:hypothetical protein